MPEIKTIRLGDDVSVVRRKISMEAKDYSSLWRSINTKALEICQRTYGVVSLKETITLPAINELRDYYANTPDAHTSESTDPEIRQKILDAFAVDGFAAWTVHNAIKRNNNKNRRATHPTPAPYSPSGASAGEPSGVEGAEEGATEKAIFDPIRDI